MPVSMATAALRQGRGQLMIPPLRGGAGFALVQMTLEWAAYPVSGNRLAEGISIRYVERSLRTAAGWMPRKQFRQVDAGSAPRRRGRAAGRYSIEVLASSRKLTARAFRQSDQTPNELE